MKRTFEVTVTEILSRTIEDVEADTLEEAIEQVQKDYENEEIVLDWSDFQESTITGTEVTETEPTLVVDYLNTDQQPDIAAIFGITTEYAAMKVEYHCSYPKADEYSIESDVDEAFSNLVQACDCKNGVQLYVHKNDVYLCITGSNYYDTATGKYKGTDKVYVYFKNFNWED